jgi:hypothetical protein
MVGVENLERKSCSWIYFFFGILSSENALTIVIFFFDFGAQKPNKLDISFDHSFKPNRSHLFLQIYLRQQYNSQKPRTFFVFERQLIVRISTRIVTLLQVAEISWQPKDANNNFGFLCL